MLQGMAAEVSSRGGEQAFRVEALQGLSLRKVIKESHASPIHKLAFNTTSAALGNLLATVGGDQATVYDDRHMGDHPAVVVQFKNAETPQHKGGVRDTCCSCRMPSAHVASAGQELPAYSFGAPPN